MKTETHIPEMKTVRAKRSAGFTIIELLMVIAIMAIVAGLIVGLAAVSGDSRKINRARTELARLVTLIEAYKSKVGVYPPDNPSHPHINSLVYELGGAIRHDAETPNPVYETPFGKIPSNQIWAVYGGDDVFPGPEHRAGLLNAVDLGAPVEDAKVHRILKTLRPDEFAVVSGWRSLAVPIDDPNGQRPNPWKYRVGTNAVHNPESFDLWVDIKLRAGARTIGNWKE
jgi:prepilin-type N-terminal cleavage/methylation domain-containing protein